MKSVAIFCGAASGSDPNLLEEVVNLVRLLAQNDIEVIYGGGKLGIMGLVADNALANGGSVIGIIPKHLEKFEGAHLSLSELHVVDTMHTRKQKM